mgnify:CR=1 FL=1
MGEVRVSRAQLVMGWAATLVMIAASALFLAFVAMEPPTALEPGPISEEMWVPNARS